MATLAEIEQATKAFADRRELLKLRVEELHTQIEEIKRELLPEIKAAAADAANAKGQLEALVDGSRALFTKPRSVIISGIKVGLQKGKGKLEIPDANMVINLIRKHIPESDQALYIETTEKVIKKNLGDLPVATLKKLGIKVEDNGDVVLIKPTDSDVDKLVNAMLKDADSGEDDLAEAA